MNHRRSSQGKLLRLQGIDTSPQRGRARSYKDYMEQIARVHEKRVIAHHTTLVRFLEGWLITMTWNIPAMRTSKLMGWDGIEGSEWIS